MSRRNFLLHRFPLWISAGLFLFISGTVSSKTESSVSETGALLGTGLNRSPSLFLNVDATRHALNPSLTVVRNTLLAAWAEFNLEGVPQIYAKRWDGQGWQPMGKNLNLDSRRRALEPTLAGYQDKAYLAWVELNARGLSRLYVKHWDGTSWVGEGGSLNLDPNQPAWSPALASDPSGLYLAWSESNANRIPQIYVRTLTDKGWTPVGISLNRNPVRDAVKPSLAIVGQSPFVAWSGLSEQNTFQLFVSRWTGTEWQPVGQALNRNPRAHALNPSLVNHSNDPHVAWIEFNPDGVAQLHVARWSEGRWAPVGEVLNEQTAHHALSPMLASNGRTIFVTWIEINPQGIPQLYVKSWTGQGWVRMGDRLNLNPKHIASTPSLLIVGQTPVVAWKEADDQGRFQIYVKQLKE